MDHSCHFLTISGVAWVVLRAGGPRSRCCPWRWRWWRQQGVPRHLGRWEVGGEPRSSPLQSPGCPHTTRPWWDPPRSLLVLSPSCLLPPEPLALGQKHPPEDPGVKRQLRWEGRFLLLQPGAFIIRLCSYTKAGVFPCVFFPPPPPSPALMSIRAEAPAETPRSRRAHRAGPQDVEPAAYWPYHFAETSAPSQKTCKQRKWSLFLLSTARTRSRAARLWPSGFHYD